MDDELKSLEDELRQMPLPSASNRLVDALEDGLVTHCRRPKRLMHPLAYALLAAAAAVIAVIGVHRTLNQEQLRPSPRIVEREVKPTPLRAPQESGNEHRQITDEELAALSRSLQEQPIHVQRLLVSPKHEGIVMQDGRPAHRVRYNIVDYVEFPEKNKRPRYFMEKREEVRTIPVRFD